MVYNIEKMLKENGDKVSGSEKSRRRDGSGRCEEDARRHAERKRAERGAGETDRRLAQAGRGHVQGHRGNAAPNRWRQAAAGTTAEEPKKDEGVIDAEYVDVEDKK